MQQIIDTSAVSRPGEGFAELREAAHLAASLVFDDELARPVGQEVRGWIIRRIASLSRPTDTQPERALVQRQRVVDLRDALKVMVARHSA